jgi:folate-dependent phosphoribosylglycinamide formyltransferase PurN
MKIVLLAGNGQSTLFIYNAISEVFPIEKVIIEDKISTKKLIEIRIKKLGFLKVFNQLLFQIIISKLLRFTSKKRIKFLTEYYKLSEKLIEDEKLNYVPSVNDSKCISLLIDLNPDVIIVNGTRIISSKVLESTSALFINTHVGITPQYRGVHGAYWALLKNDIENCGVTIHIVDKGIDTGALIKQATIEISEQDNFATYPLHQYGVAINLMKQTLKDYYNNKLKTFKKENVESNLYYHPTFSAYIYNRFFKDIK